MLQNSYSIPPSAHMEIYCDDATPLRSAVITVIIYSMWHLEVCYNCYVHINIRNYTCDLNFEKGHFPAKYFLKFGTCIQDELLLNFSDTEFIDFL